MRDWFVRRVKHSRTPIFVGAALLAVAPMAWAKGPIVRAGADLWALAWAVIGTIL